MPSDIPVSATDAMPLQHLKADGSVVNRSTFGRLLQKFLWSDSMASYIQSFGWLDGGCWILAEALQRWIGEASTLCATGRQGALFATDHVAVALSLPQGEVYLDGDGLTDRAGLLRKMEMHELRENPWLGQVVFQALAGAEISRDISLSMEIAARLRARFGAFDINRLSTDLSGFMASTHAPLSAVCADAIVSVKPNLFHVGTMDIANKRSYSHEGIDGLSVSTTPDAWRRIARGAVSGNDWQLKKRGHQFLDYHRLSEDDLSVVCQWGVTHGYLTESVVFECGYFDDEIEEDLRFELFSREEAEAEAGDDEIIERQGYRPTERLEREFGGKSYDSVILPFARDLLGVDGVWWNDRLDVVRLSAPRGVIFQKNLASWSISKVVKDLTPEA